MVAVDRRGAWLDAGWTTDLALPRTEWTADLAIGDRALVIVHRDAGGPVASMKLNERIAEASVGLRVGAKVSLVVARTSDLGVVVVVDHRFWGLIFADRLFRPLRVGQRLDGWVEQVRDDGKLDITLRERGYAAVDPLTDRILDRLKASRGFLAVGDHSTPDAIRDAFGVSKKQFKQAVGALFKRRRITLEADGIRLVPGTEGQ
ncbi:MAG: RNA-binding protein [Myxococcota bacterium]